MLSRLVTAGLALSIAGGATLVTAVPAIAQSSSEERRFADAQARFDREYQIYRQAVDRYQGARQAPYPSPAPGGYYAPPPAGYNAPQPSGYYDTDRVEQGYDPARNDGTTGRIVGAAGGGLLGNIIAGGHSKTVGTLLGAAGGALAGKAIDQSSSEVRCR